MFGELGGIFVFLEFLYHRKSRRRGTTIPKLSGEQSTPRATEECFMTTCDAAAAVVFIARALRGL